MDSDAAGCAEVRSASIAVSRAQADTNLVRARHAPSLRGEL